MIDENLCFMPNLTQTIINIMMLDYKPNIHKELHYTFFQEFLSSKLENYGARWSSLISTHTKACGDKNYVQIKTNMQWIHLQ